MRLLLTSIVLAAHSDVASDADKTYDKFAKSWTSFWDRFNRHHDGDVEDSKSKKEEQELDQEAVEEDNWWDFFPGKEEKTTGTTDGEWLLVRTDEEIPLGYRLANAEEVAEHMSDVQDYMGNPWVIACLADNKRVTGVGYHSKIEDKGVCGEKLLRLVSDEEIQKLEDELFTPNCECREEPDELYGKCDGLTWGGKYICYVKNKDACEHAEYDNTIEMWWTPELCQQDKEEEDIFANDDFFNDELEKKECKCTEDIFNFYGACIGIMWQKRQLCYVESYYNCPDAEYDPDNDRYWSHDACNDFVSNTPEVCQCPNGVAASYEDCQPVFGDVHCIACDFEYRLNGFGECEKDDFHQEPETEAPVITEATTKAPVTTEATTERICKCTNGAPVIGSDCRFDVLEQCASCNTGYELNGSNCVETIPVTCEDWICDMGFGKSEEFVDWGPCGNDCDSICCEKDDSFHQEPDTEAPVITEATTEATTERICKCTNGTPVIGSDCFFEVLEQCASCNTGYELDDVHNCVEIISEVEAEPTVVTEDSEKRDKEPVESPETLNEWFVNIQKKVTEFSNDVAAQIETASDYTEDMVEKLNEMFCKCSEDVHFGYGDCKGSLHNGKLVCYVENPESDACKDVHMSYDVFARKSYTHELCFQPEPVTTEPDVPEYPVIDFPAVPETEEEKQTLPEIVPVKEEKQTLPEKVAVKEEAEVPEVEDEVSEESEEEFGIDEEEEEIFVKRTEEEDCWKDCNEKNGKCDWCGGNGRCCRKGHVGGGCNGQEGSQERHMCIYVPTKPLQCDDSTELVLGYSCEDWKWNVGQNNREWNLSSWAKVDGVCYDGDYNWPNNKILNESCKALCQPKVCAPKEPEEDCWDACNEKNGQCDWCQFDGKCCRKDHIGGGCSGAEGGENHHMCVYDKPIALLKSTYPTSRLLQKTLRGSSHARQLKKRNRVKEIRERKKKNKRHEEEQARHRHKMQNRARGIPNRNNDKLCIGKLCFPTR